MESRVYRRYTREPNILASAISRDGLVIAWSGTTRRSPPGDHCAGDHPPPLIPPPDPPTSGGRAHLPQTGRSVPPPLRIPRSTQRSADDKPHAGFREFHYLPADQDVIITGALSEPGPGPVVCSQCVNVESAARLMTGMRYVRQG